MRTGSLFLKRHFRIPLLLAALLVIGASGYQVREWLGATETFGHVRDKHTPSDTWIVDQEGIPLESLRTIETHRSLEWVKLADVSPAFTKRLLETEDRRFYRHFGIDLLSVASAVRSAIHGEGLRGASTLTMQLAKNLDRDVVAKNRASRWTAKLRQAVKSVWLETFWTKEQILEAYINRVTYHGEIQGLRAASLGFFSKAPQGLDEIESALLVVLLRSPSASLDVVKQRLGRLFMKDSAERQRAFELAEAVYEQPLKLSREREVVPVISKYFTESAPGSSVIKTTLSASVQRFATSIVREQLRELKRQNVRDAAVLVLETKTGRPVAYVANGGPQLSSAYQVDGVQSRRQLGSTIKAFVYGTAYDLGVISTTSLLLDSPENVAVGSGQVYQPRNYDHVFRGPVGAAEAFGSSLNVPAVRALSLVGERRVIDKLREFGFTGLKDDDQYGPSLALGTVDASLWELAQGYRQLSLYSNSKVFSDLAKRQIFESLSVAENRRFTFGVESLLQLPFAAASKTGTSKDMRDNWCVGFTSEYTVAAWVGNFNGDPMWNVSGITGAAPLWRKLMIELHRHRLPEDLLMNYQRPDAPLAVRTLAKIRYPVRDMLIGIDPDIPDRLQKIPLRVEGNGKDLSFSMNGRRVGLVNQMPFWTPVKGKHTLQLLDRKGQKIDETSFFVR